MKARKIITATALLGTGVLWAVPHVDQDTVTMAQDPYNRKVTVSYTLRDEAAIVTLDIQTNATGTAEGPWVSIGAENIGGLVGDADRLVEPGDRRIVWQPTATWPDRKINGANTRAVVTARSVANPPDFMALDLLPPHGIFYYDSAEQVPGGVTNDVYKSTKLLMRRMHCAGQMWLMGNWHSGWAAYEVPHYVALSDDYYIGVYEVTQRQCELMVGQRWSAYNAALADYHPADCLAYDRLRGSISAYNFPACGHRVADGTLVAAFRGTFAAAGLFDLPTEAQWEFAAKGGHYDWTYCFDGVPNEYCVFGSDTAVVGSKLPNGYGLYDVQGNVGEWVIDVFCAGDDYGRADGSVVVDPHGVAYDEGAGRKQPALRGGSHVESGPLAVYWRDEFLSSATDRNYYGCRLVCNFALPGVLPAAE